MKPQDSLPGDFVGTDSTGKVRIDRVIPLPWVLGVIAAGVANAAAMYYGQQQLVEKVTEMRADIRAITNALNTSASRDMEHSMRLQEIERRVNALETKR